MTLKKIISGGQRGADEGGLLAAEIKGLETGGWMPKDFMTKEGPKWDYEKRFGMRATIASAYSERTGLNVRYSDATIRFAYDFRSPGERCTLAAIWRHSKPHMDVDLSSMEMTVPDETVRRIADFIENNGVETLNVAGNAVRSATQLVCDIMCAVIDELRARERGDAEKELVNDLSEIRGVKFRKNWRHGKMEEIRKLVADGHLQVMEPDAALVEELKSHEGTDRKVNERGAGWDKRPDHKRTRRP